MVVEKAFSVVVTNICALKINVKRVLQGLYE